MVSVLFLFSFVSFSLDYCYSMQAVHFLIYKKCFSGNYVKYQITQVVRKMYFVSCFLMLRVTSALGKSYVYSSLLFNHFYRSFKQNMENKIQTENHTENRSFASIGQS